MWKELKTQDEIDAFMESVYYFHDSCITEMKYISGAYANDKGMYPINDKRVLSVILQGALNIELEFSKLKYMNLKPNDENYTCEILGASMYLIGGLIYWCDSDVLKEKIKNYDGTLICAEKLRWRNVKVKND